MNDPKMTVMAVRSTQKNPTARNPVQNAMDQTYEPNSLYEKKHRNYPNDYPNPNEMLKKVREFWRALK